MRLNLFINLMKGTITVEKHCGGEVEMTAHGDQKVGDLKIPALGLRSSVTIGISEPQLPHQQE